MATIALNFNSGSGSFAIRTAVFAIVSRLTVARWMSAFFVFGHKNSWRLDPERAKRLPLAEPWTILLKSLLPGKLRKNL